MLTYALLLPYRVRFMNFLALNPALTAFRDTGSGHSADTPARVKPANRLSGQRMKWPFSVSIGSAVKTSVLSSAAVDYFDESGSSQSSHFVT
jgi:hypothetical protein